MSGLLPSNGEAPVREKIAAPAPLLIQEQLSARLKEFGNSNERSRSQASGFLVKDGERDPDSSRESRSDRSIGLSTAVYIPTDERTCSARPSLIRTKARPEAVRSHGSICHCPSQFGEFLRLNRVKTRTIMHNQEIQGAEI